jgi:isoleucyl-tRNA synthetase
MCADKTAETPDYKDTLNLPKTDFPMRAGLPKREPDWLARWEKIGVYDRLREKEGRAPFTLHDGPPYANGNLHIGHALNKTIKDIIVRSHQMLGHDSRYVPGWDCHGLPIEWKIEQQYREKGQDKDAVDVVEFRQECRRFAEHWIDVQREEFKRLGVTGNWDDPYLTMDFHAERVIAEEFMTFLMNGSLYQGSKPVMWSPVEKTALAEAEVEYHDRQTDAVWVPFRVAVDAEESEKMALLVRGRTGSKCRIAFHTALRSYLSGRTILETPGGPKVIIWTTTPWTLPQNRAICFGPEIAYGLYEVTGRPAECWARIGDRYLLADALAEEALSAMRLEPSMYRRLRDVTADELGRSAAPIPCAAPKRRNGEWDFDVPCSRAIT